MNVNLISIALLVRALVNELEAGQGSIVNVATIAAVRSTPGLGAYAASKAALISMSQTAALEYAQYGIRAPTHSLRWPGSSGFPASLALPGGRER